MLKTSVGDFSRIGRCTWSFGE